jgi:hypothetical protein
MEENESQALALMPHLLKPYIPERTTRKPDLTAGPLGRI